MRDGSCTLSCILGDRWEMGAASRVQPLGLAFGFMVFSTAPELFYDPEPSVKVGSTLDFSAHRRRTNSGQCPNLRFESGIVGHSYGEHETGWSNLVL